jgi:hypothetical protein
MIVALIIWIACGIIPMLGISIATGLAGLGIPPLFVFVAAAALGPLSWLVALWGWRR